MWSADKLSLWFKSTLEWKKYFGAGIWTISGNTKDLLLAGCSDSTSDRARGVYGVLGIESGLAICKTNALSGVLSLWPQW